MSAHMVPSTERVLAEVQKMRADGLTIDQVRTVLALMWGVRLTVEENEDGVVRLVVRQR